MEIAKKLSAKQDMRKHPPVTIAFLGDSVTQGCFECYIKNNGNVETVFDYPSAYSTRVREILNLLYPNVQVNIINSGISGDSAIGGLARLERDVLRYCPDLTVLSFGLNDCGNPNITLEAYLDAIREMVTRLREAGSEVVFLTQNFMNTDVSCHLHEETLRRIASETMVSQNEGILKEYMTCAAQTAEAAGARICDVHSAWEALAKCGVDTTELLSNKINHPIRQIHYYMAIRIVETMLEIR